MMPFFTIIVPVYNRAASLGEALRSVLEQTDQDFEVIVVDDGSSDDPARSVHELGDPRMTVLRQENSGAAAARNAGIDAARGQFVAFLDSDDRYLPLHLAAMRQLLANTENVAGYAPVIVDRGGGRRFLKPPRAIGSEEHMATYVLCDRGFVPTTTLVVRSEWARQTRYDERLGYAQDTDFCIRLFLAGCRFAMADEPGAVWNDVADVDRVSSGRKGARVTEWLERMRPEIPSRAYRGAQGWLIAKGVAASNVSAALKLYISSAANGCYRPRMALVIFLQVFMSDRTYRRLANLFVFVFRGAVWSRSDRIAYRAER